MPKERKIQKWLQGVTIQNTKKNMSNVGAMHIRIYQLCRVLAGYKYCRL